MDLKKRDVENIKNRIVICIFTFLFAVSVIMLPVSADDYSGLAGIAQNDVNYIIDILNIAKDVASGQKSVQEGYSAVRALNDRVVSQNVKDMIAFPFSSETELNGVTPRDFADKITTNVRQGLRGLGGEIDDNTLTTDNVDTKGYGAIMHIDTANSSLPWDNYYCDYIVVSVVDGSILSATFYGSNNLHTWNDVYTGDNSASFKDSLTFDNRDILNSIGNYTTKFYGDIRYSDGSSADSIKSPTQSITQGIDTSQLTDQELIDLLQDMINKLNIEFPDLSTIEGLLRAIYNKECGISSQITYSTSEINAAILALTNSNAAGSENIVNTLLEIRKELQNGGSSSGGSSSDSDPEIKGVLYNCYPVEHYSNWFTSLFGDTDKMRVIYLNEIYDVNPDGTIYFPKDITSADYGKYYINMSYTKDIDIELNVNDNSVANKVDLDFEYKNLVTIVNLSSSKKRLLNSVVDTVEQLISFAPYQAVTHFMSTVQPHIFVSSAPQDITVDINIDTEIGKPLNGSYTILSADIIDKNAEALLMIKVFTGLLITYSWLLWMRKKSVSIVGGD